MPILFAPNWLQLSHQLEDKPGTDLQTMTEAMCWSVGLVAIETALTESLVILDPESDGISPSDIWMHLAGKVKEAKFYWTLASSLASKVSVELIKSWAVANLDSRDAAMLAADPVAEVQRAIESRAAGLSKRTRWELACDAAVLTSSVSVLPSAAAGLVMAVEEIADQAPLYWAAMQKSDKTLERMTPEERRVAFASRHATEELAKRDHIVVRLLLIAARAAGAVIGEGLTAGAAVYVFPSSWSIYTSWLTSLYIWTC